MSRAVYIAYRCSIGRVSDFPKEKMKSTKEVAALAKRKSKLRKDAEVDPEDVPFSHSRFG